MPRRLLSLPSSSVEEPPLNLTALIDVVFVILIAFILIAPLLKLENVQLAEASGVPSAALSLQEASPIQIHVLSNNSILLNGSPISLSALTPLLLEAKSRYPTARPQLFHDANGSFGTYQAVKNCLEGAGFSELDIVLRP